MLTPKPAEIPFSGRGIISVIQLSQQAMGENTDVRLALGEDFGQEINSFNRLQTSAVHLLSQSLTMNLGCQPVAFRESLMVMGQMPLMFRTFLTGDPALLRVVCISPSQMMVYNLPHFPLLLGC